MQCSISEDDESCFVVAFSCHLGHVDQKVKASENLSDAFNAYW